MRNAQALWSHRLNPPWLVFLFGLLLIAQGCQTSSVESIATAWYYQDPALLARAWRQPVAATYRDHFEYQIHGAFCGPATVINLFRSLDFESYTQDSLFERSDIGYWKARAKGLTLDELAQLIRANANLEVTVLRDLTLEEFRVHLRRANDPAYRYLINFNRQPLFGVKVGHHSPLGGYLPDADLVFVLDVLERYQPFLIPAARLHEAIDTVDAESGQKRGLLLVRTVTRSVRIPIVSRPPPVTSVSAFSAMITGE